MSRTGKSLFGLVLTLCVAAAALLFGPDLASADAVTEPADRPIEESTFFDFTKGELECNEATGLSSMDYGVTNTNGQLFIETGGVDLYLVRRYDAKRSHEIATPPIADGASYSSTMEIADGVYDLYVTHLTFAGVAPFYKGTLTAYCSFDPSLVPFDFEPGVVTDGTKLYMGFENRGRKAQPLFDRYDIEISHNGSVFLDVDDFEDACDGDNENSCTGNSLQVYVDDRFGELCTTVRFRHDRGDLGAPETVCVNRGPRLPAPVVSAVNDTVPIGQPAQWTWTAVDNASRYRASVDGNPFFPGTTSATSSSFTRSPGTHCLEVRALPTDPQVFTSSLLSNEACLFVGEVTIDDVVVFGTPECAAEGTNRGALEYTVENKSNETRDYRLIAGPHGHNPLTVAAGATASFTLGGIPDGIHEVSVEFDGETVSSVNDVTFDCLQLETSIGFGGPRCGVNDAEKGTLNFRVTNGDLVTNSYRLIVGPHSHFPLEVAPNSTASFVLKGIPFGTWDASVELDGTVLRTRSNRVFDCASARPSSLTMRYETGATDGLGTRMQATWEGQADLTEVRWFYDMTGAEIRTANYEGFSHQFVVGGGNASSVVPDEPGRTRNRWCVAIRGTGGGDTSNWTGPRCAFSFKCMDQLVTVSIARGESPTDGNDVILGTNGPDDIYALDGENLICALGGDDEIVTGDDVDNVYAGAGDDVVSAGGGDDRIWGSSGEDTIGGGEGDDYINGGANDDSLLGGPDADRIFGAAGDDLASGEAGDDYLNGGADDDRLNGGIGDDRVLGAAGEDFLEGGDNDDYLNGGKDNDTLLGGSGIDDLRGGNNDDELFGGDDDDRLHGGAGHDYLDGQGGVDFGNGNSGGDVCLNVSTTRNCEVTTALGANVLRIMADNDMLTTPQTEADRANNRTLLNGSLRALTVDESIEVMDAIRERGQVEEFIRALIMVDASATFDDVVALWEEVLNGATVDYLIEALLYTTFHETTGPINYHDGSGGVFIVDYTNPGVLMHETNHSFNWQHGLGGLSGLNEGFSIAITQPAADRNIAETVYGTVLFYRDIGLDGFPNDIDMGDTNSADAKGIDVMNYVMTDDKSKINWFDEDEVQQIFEDHWEALNRNQPFNDWLVDAEQATQDGRTALGR